MQIPHGTLTVVGDLNVQLGSPRDETETAVTEELTAAWHQLGSLVVESDLQTRRGASGHSTIDYIVVPHSVCLRCYLSRIWTAESDHAWLDASYGSQ